MFVTRVRRALGALQHRAHADQPGHHEDGQAGDDGSKAAGFQHPGLRELQRTIGVAVDHESIGMPLTSLVAELMPERSQHALGGVAVLKAGDDHPLLPGPGNGGRLTSSTYHR